MVNLMKAQPIMRYTRAKSVHLGEVAAVSPGDIIIYHPVDTRPRPFRGACR